MDDPVPHPRRSAPVPGRPRQVVCTLRAAEFEVRVLEWADIGCLSLGITQIKDGVVATFPVDLADAVADLAERENGCCGSWLSTSVEQMADAVRLRVTTKNPAGLDVILAMAGLT